MPILFTMQLNKLKMQTKTIIIFFIIAIVIAAGGWIALTELTTLHTGWCALISISTAALLFYLYQKFK